MKVREVITMLNTYKDQEQEICASWWDRDIFDPSYRDENAVPIPEDVWNSAVMSFDEAGGFDSVNEHAYDMIQRLIDDAKAVTL